MINGNMDSKSLDHLYDCLSSILYQTKIPVKYLVASAVLRLTESKISWRERDEENILIVLKVLHFNIQTLDECGRDFMANNNENLETF